MPDLASAVDVRNRAGKYLLKSFSLMIIDWCRPSGNETDSPGGGVNTLPADIFSQARQSGGDSPKYFGPEVVEFLNAIRVVGIRQIHARKYKLVPEPVTEPDGSARGHILGRKPHHPRFPGARLYIKPAFESHFESPVERRAGTVLIEYRRRSGGSAGSVPDQPVPAKGGKGDRFAGTPFGPVGGGNSIGQRAVHHGIPIIDHFLPAERRNLCYVFQGVDVSRQEPLGLKSRTVERYMFIRIGN